MSSRRGVRHCETEDRDSQGCNACGEDEACQYTWDEVMFPEIVECVKGAKTLEGAQGGVNVGEARHRAIRVRSSSESIKSSGSKKSRGPEQFMQGQRGFNLPFCFETPRVLLKRQIVCHRCGQPGHIRFQCQRGQKSCFTCGEFDHIAKNCPQRKIMQDELGLVQPPGTRLIVSQPQPQSTQRQPTVRVSTSPENFRSQERKSQRESNQTSQNQINIGPPTLSGNQGIPQLNRICSICRERGHMARNCPWELGVQGEPSSVQQDKYTPRQQQMQFHS